MPAPDQIDDASNQQRLDACKRIFAKQRFYYVGSDKVFTLPINGVFYGVVAGSDPRTSAALGGAFFDVSQVLDKIDSLQINWQFNDSADPRKNDYGAYPNLTGQGYYYMDGVPVVHTRGVVNVSLSNKWYSRISGEVAYFTDLAQDDVHF